MDSWRRVGAVVGGMRRLGYDVELKQLGESWHVNFGMRGDDQVVGTAWEETVWRVVQRATWVAINGEARVR